MKNPIKRRARLALSLSNRIERMEGLAEKRAKRNGDTLPAGMYLSRTEARALSRLHRRENALVAEMSQHAGGRGLPVEVSAPAEVQGRLRNRRRNKRARIAAHMRRLPPYSGRPTRHDLRRIRRAADLSALALSAAK